MADQLGPAAAAALMECIPPFGWHEIATKSNLRVLQERMDLRFEASEAHFDARLHAEMTRSIKWTVSAVIGGLTALGVAVGLVSAFVS